jgi:hypothetical protein
MITDDWKNATPEQLLLWKYIKDRFAPNAIVPLHYQGVIAGNEFTVYNAAKLYLALTVNFDLNIGGGTGGDRVDFHNELNVMFYRSRTLSSYWNATTATEAAIYYKLHVKNIWFSRIIQGGYTVMTFTGYRLTI